MSFIRFDHFVISIFLIAIFSIGMAMMIVDMENNYDSVNMTDDDFKNMTDIISETIGTAEQAKNRTLNADVEGEDQSWESMTKGSYNAVRLVKNSFGIFSELMQHAAQKLHIPTIFLTIGFSILVISIVFATIYMIFRFVPK